ncbi:MAG: hypothetical protein K2Q29_11870 [Sphingomonadales bacterium]|nr:hypothetical protein [Sphingomonadales bacterium]
MLELLAAFVFMIHKDSMTDELTYEARLGDERQGISVMCGNATDGKLAVEFRADRILAEYSDQRALVEYRFDEGEFQRRWPHSFGERAAFIDKEAQEFAQQARSARRIRARIKTYSGEFVEFDTRILLNRQAVDRVLEACPNST